MFHVFVSRVKDANTAETGPPHQRPAGKGLSACEHQPHLIILRDDLRTFKITLVTDFVLRPSKVAGTRCLQCGGALLLLDRMSARVHARECVLSSADAPQRYCWLPKGAPGAGIQPPFCRNNIHHAQFKACYELNGVDIMAEQKKSYPLHIPIEEPYSMRTMWRNPWAEPREGVATLTFGFGHFLAEDFRDRNIPVVIVDHHSKMPELPTRHSSGCAACRCSAACSYCVHHREPGSVPPTSMWFWSANFFEFRSSGISRTSYLRGEARRVDNFRALPEGRTNTFCLHLPRARSVPQPTSRLPDDCWFFRNIQ